MTENCDATRSLSVSDLFVARRNPTHKPVTYLLRNDVSQSNKVFYRGSYQCQLTLSSCGPWLPAETQSVYGRRPALLLACCPLPSDVPDVAGQDLFDALAVAGGEVIHDGVVLGG